MLEERGASSKAALDALPEGIGGAIKELSEYEFFDDEASRKFQALLDLLRQRMMESMFQSIREDLQGMDPQQMQGAKEMLRALNQMLRDRFLGLEPDFQGFMDKYGQYFGDAPPESLDQLLESLARQSAAVHSLMESMTDEMRQELEELMYSVLDSEAIQELEELASHVFQVMPPDELQREYPFMGDEPLTLQQAMEVVKQLQGLDDLERDISDVMRSGDLDNLDPDEVERQLGEEARKQLERLQEIVQKLEAAGYLRREDDRMELTPRAIRRLSQLALKEVFAELEKDRAGGHETFHRGAGGDHTGETKTFEYGDTLDIDLNRTLRNAIFREGPSVPIRISPGDLEVHRTEHRSQAATVLLLDQSRSMGMFGNFTSAKRVALALYSLVQTQFPRDRFSVIGFSDYAMEIEIDRLAEMTWNMWVSGTNMHHALMLSRRFLSKAKGATKQIIMITDGEPTAHLEGGQAYFSHPPSYRTMDKTLGEVKRCTREGITINTFMLEAEFPLMDFVDKVTRINRGRAFYTTPGQLGRYVMVDYLKSRRKMVGQAI